MTDSDFRELTTGRRSAPPAQPDTSAQLFSDPFADLLTLDRDVVDGSAPVARHGHFGDGLFGEARPTAPQSLVTRLLSGTVGSLVAVGAALGLVLGVGASLVGVGGDAPSTTARPGQSGNAAAGSDQQAAGQGGQPAGAPSGQQAGAGQQAGQTGAQGGQNGQAGSQAKPSVPVDAQGRPTLTGSFTLWAADPQKNACADHPQVPDITSGATVLLADGAGKELARTTLGKGAVEATRRGCVFPFRLAGLPQADQYRLTVGRQGALTFAAKDLAGNGWRVQLNLGLPSQTG